MLTLMLIAQLCMLCECEGDSNIVQHTQAFCQCQPAPNTYLLKKNKKKKGKKKKMMTVRERLFFFFVCLLFQENLFITVENRRKSTKITVHMDIKVYLSTSQVGKPYNKLLTSLACPSHTEKNQPSVVFFTDLVALSPQCYDLRPIIPSMTLMGLVCKKLIFIVIKRGQFSPGPWLANASLDRQV